MTRLDEAGERVDVTIGVIVLEHPRQEDHARRAERVLQTGLPGRSIGAAHEQTRRGREDGVDAIGFDRAALQHEIEALGGQSAELGDASGEILIARHRILAAPAIEAKAERAIATEDRKRVAGPRVAVGDANELGVHLWRLGVGMHEQTHRFGLGDRVDEGRDLSARCGQVLPLIVEVRPRHPTGGVGGRLVGNLHSVRLMTW